MDTDREVIQEEEALVISEIERVGLLLAEYKYFVSDLDDGLDVIKSKYTSKIKALSAYLESLRSSLVVGTIGTRLRKMYLSRGLQQGEFAESVGVSKDKFCKMLSGDCNITEIFLEKVSSKYNVSIEYLRKGL